MLPGLIYLLINNYIPMLGTVIAFKSVHYGKNFFDTYISSPFVGLKNFEFFLNTDYAWVITRNTVLYNLVFIMAGMALAVTSAICLNEIVHVKLSKTFQSFMILPNFLSWVVIAGLVYALLANNGFVNKSILAQFNRQPIDFYTQIKFWPYILTFTQIWFNLGVNTVIFLASLTGISEEYYEAAMIDGATRWQQIKGITLPLLKPTVIIMLLVWLGGIFKANFGLFYNVPRESGVLFNVTNVLDTYVFRSLKIGGEIEMAAAASFYQSVVGFVVVMISNTVVKRFNQDNGLF